MLEKWKSKSTDILDYTKIEILAKDRVQSHTK